MERDYGREIDELRNQLNELVQETLPQKMEEIREKLEAVFPNKQWEERMERVHGMHEMHPDSRLSQ